MEATNIVFDPATSAITVTIVPNPAVPEEIALMGCAYAILMAFPGDQVTAMKYIFGTFKVLGFSLLPPPWSEPDASAAKAMLMAEPKVMDAIRRAAPEVAAKIEQP